MRGEQILVVGLLVLVRSLTEGLVPACRLEYLLNLRADLDQRRLALFPTGGWQCAEDGREAMRVTARDVVTDGNFVNPPA